MIKKIILFVLIFLSFFTVFAFAGKGEIPFVETQVDLQATGKAVVAYTVQYRVEFLSDSGRSGSS